MIILAILEAYNSLKALISNSQNCLKQEFWLELKKDHCHSSSISLYSLCNDTSKFRREVLRVKGHSQKQMICIKNLQIVMLAFADLVFFTV